MNRREMIQKAAVVALACCAPALPVMLQPYTAPAFPCYVPGRVYGFIKMAGTMFFAVREYLNEHPSDRRYTIVFQGSHDACQQWCDQARENCIRRMRRKAGLA